MTLIDRKTITDHINRKRPFTVTFKYADREFIMMVSGIYAKLLTAHDQLYILNSVISIMREVMANAQKANAKRLYFSVYGLNITKSGDYKKGMDRFKDDFMQNPQEMRAILMKSDYDVDINFSITEDEISIDITNNAAVKTLHNFPRKLTKFRQFCHCKFQTQQVRYIRGVVKCAENYVALNVILPYRVGLSSLPIHPEST